MKFERFHFLCCGHPLQSSGLIKCVPDAFEYVNKILNSKVYDVCIETPLQHATKLSARLDNRVLLKREDLQPVHSFKIRGAYNRLGVSLSITCTWHDSTASTLMCLVVEHYRSLFISKQPWLL